MNALTHMSDIMIPMVIFWIVGYGIVSGVKVYETFLKGAKEGLRIVVEILPTLVGLMMAVGILRPSGFFDLRGLFLAVITCHTGGGTSGTADTAPYCENVLFLCGNRAGTGYF